MESIAISEDDSCREINNRQNNNINNANFKLKRTKRRMLLDDKIIINTVTLCYTLFGILLCVGTLTLVEANHDHKGKLCNQYFS